VTRRILSSIGIPVAGMMLPPRINWNKLFSYGEVVCFFSAWAVGLLIALSVDQSTDAGTAARQFASASDIPGVQATLQKDTRTARTETRDTALRVGSR
jgi:hypothetical protein